MSQGKISLIINQMKQYIKERKYPNHYAANAFFISIGWEKGVVDYTRISHENQIMPHGLNRLVAYAFGEL